MPKSHKRLAPLAFSAHIGDVTRITPLTSDRFRSHAETSDSGLRELIAIREIVHAFLTADRPEEVFQFALDRVSPLVGANFACVYLIDGASELMRLAAVHNWPEQFAPFLGEIQKYAAAGFRDHVNGAAQLRQPVCRRPSRPSPCSAPSRRM